MESGMSKIDEVMEIKALRRVISAYLNYTAAAEEDIKRWERSFTKLSSSHKALLRHLPKKHEELRRCVRVNSFFIINMLQAFDPPFDMGDACKSVPNLLEKNLSHSSVLQAGACRDAGIAQSINQTPERDSNIPSANCNKRQAIESNMQGKVPKSEILEPVKSSSTGTIRSCDEWSATLAQVRAEEQGEALGRKIEDNMPKDSTRESAYNGLDLDHPSYQLHVPSADVDKVRCIIRNIVRDWGEEGMTERAQCYAPILHELQRCFPHRSQESPPSCLVPGAGLGRLACEISRLGFITQGNEFSYYMLMCSSFILNQTQAPLEWTLYPWIHSNCNSLTNEDQLRAVQFPDLHPGSAGITEGFSMCAGDFVEVYSHPSQAEAWDAVVSCFFIDTAHNIVEYLEVIAKALKPGGVWINLGPLLYHFADAHSYSQEEEMSIELSLEDVKMVASHYGLILKKESMIETTYTANCKSMMQNRYFASFWTMVKEQGPGLQDNLPFEPLSNHRNCEH
ncbi:unnamed protein product [Sphagnum jensenii]|uniref:carnosine N-methyltransferase n=1 Tax=Sphagnum jensenii TaxID=128206 RepID=A0ABP1B5L0_9BRYO